MAQEKEERPKLRLKNGIEVDARRAYVKWKSLEAVHSQHPDDFSLLLALARDNLSAVLPEARASLKNEYRNSFDNAGELDPETRNILLSAFRETPDGSMLVNPFQLTIQAEIDMFDRVERKYVRAYRRLSDRGDDPPPQQAR